MRSVTSRNGGLDLIRATGAALVVATHLYHAFGQTWLGPLAAGGWAGIYLFFPLSGYLLYRPFVTGTPTLRRYAVSRIARLAPAYYLCAIVLTAAGSQAMRERWPVWATVTTNLFPGVDGSGSGLGHFSQSWTLGVEMAFYVLLPLLARSRMALTLVLLTVASLAVQPLAVGTWWRLQLPTIFWAFGLGMLVARYQDRLPAPRWLPVAGVGLIVYGLMAGDADAGRSTGFGAAALILWAARTRPALPWARWPADLSYGVYLWHLAAIAVVAGIGLTGLPLVAGSLALVVAIALASFVLLERPVLRWALAVRHDDHDPVAALAATLSARLRPTTATAATGEAARATEP